MTIEEIKKSLADRGMTQKELAERLGVNAKSLNEVLRGKNPMTEALHNHISLLLTQPREAILVYRVNISEAKATELLGERCTVIPADRATAIEAIIHHNLDELIQLGRTCTWTEEERAYLGIDSPLTLPTYGKELEPYA